MANEKRLIDANALFDRVDALCKDSGFYRPIYDGFKSMVSTAHTVDAVEVVHGRWQKSIDNECEMHKCSVCGARVVKGFYEYENPNLYCYHCGAKMDGGADNA